MSIPKYFMSFRSFELVNSEVRIVTEGLVTSSEGARVIELANSGMLE